MDIGRVASNLVLYVSIWIDQLSVAWFGRPGKVSHMVWGIDGMGRDYVCLEG